MMAAMTENERAALQRAFEKGQVGWRERKDGSENNPYPAASPYHDAWQQGWDAERKVEIG